MPERQLAPSAARDIGDSVTAHGWAQDINASGQVVGYRMMTVGSGTVYSAYLWTAAGGMTDLGRLPGTTGHAMAGAINDRGDVVGVSGGRPFLWSVGGGMRDLGLPSGATYAVPLDMSEDGRVVGSWGDGDGRMHPFLWTPDGGMRELPVPTPTKFASAWGVNSRGQVVGYGCALPCEDESLTHAFLWSPTGAVVDLGQQLGLRETYAAGITDAGVVAGTLRRASGPYVAFTWSASKGLRELGTLPGATFSWARGIGEGGHVVGYSGERAFVWTARDGMRDLGQLPGDRLQADLQAEGVNRLGQAVGSVRVPQVPRPVVFVTGSPP